MDWLDTQKRRFDLFASDLVIEEVGRGDVTAVAGRLGALAGIPLLAITEEVVALAEALIEAKALAAEGHRRLPAYCFVGRAWN